MHVSSTPNQFTLSGLSSCRGSTSWRKDTDYCRVCYRNHPGVDGDGNQMDYNPKKRACKQSKMGCPSCEEPICKKCWGNYDHCVGL
jgi:hypothetical protein